MRSTHLDWPSLAVVGVIAGAVVGIVVLAGAALFYLVMAPAPLPTPSLPPTLVPAALGSIRGRIWHDQCAVSLGHAGEPSVPSAGCVVSPDGSIQADGFQDPGEPPLAGARIDLGLGACPANTAESSQALGDGSYAFANLPQGTYCISVNAGDQPLMQLVPGRWSFPAGVAGPTAAMTVDLQSGETRDGVDFGWDYEFLPVPEPPPTPAPTPAPTSAACTDAAAFVADVTVPDGTWFAPGTSFDKIWRLRNAGTCSWDDSYDVVFISGQNMGGSAAAPLGRTVRPGETVDVQVRLTAPWVAGSYRGNWMLRNSAGVLFGVGSRAETAFWALIHVGDSSAAGAVWRGEYFANRRLSGSPALIRQDVGIDFDWGSGSPNSAVPSDDFSVRWTTTLELEGGSYDFRVLVDDGARLWVDGELVIDEWEDGAAREDAGRVTLVRGRHDLRLEYYERSQRARIRLTWIRATGFPDWKGEYFGNRDLRGPAVLVRNDADVRFDWGTGAPASGMTDDSFSARWTTKIIFETGRYRLNAVADDGVRVYIDGVLVIDEWHDSSGSQTYSVERDLATKTDVVVEYYERSGRASVRFWYERLATPTVGASPSSTPSATASATATVSPTPSSTPTITETPTDTPTPTPP